MLKDDRRFRAAAHQEAERLKAEYQHWCRKQGLEEAGAVLDRDWARMLTVSQFPNAHWPHLRTSNPIESPFAALRPQTDAAKRFKKVSNATESMKRVHDGTQSVNGVRAQELP